MAAVCDLDDDVSTIAGARVGRDGDRTAVWLRGEHDCATMLVCTALVEAIRDGLGDVVVDMSEVSFMDVSTVRSLIRGRELLAVRARRLSVRSPPHSTRMVLELCDLADLIEPASTATNSGSGGAMSALGSWVDVPPLRLVDHLVEDESERSPDRPPPSPSG